MVSQVTQRDVRPLSGDDWGAGNVVICCIFDRKSRWRLSITWLIFIVHRPVDEICKGARKGMTACVKFAWCHTSCVLCIVHRATQNCALCNTKFTANFILHCADVWKVKNDSDNPIRCFPSMATNAFSVFSLCHWTVTFTPCTSPISPLLLYNIHNLIINVSPQNGHLVFSRRLRATFYKYCFGVCGLWVPCHPILVITHLASS